MNVSNVINSAFTSKKFQNSKMKIASMAGMEFLHRGSIKILMCCNIEV